MPAQRIPAQNRVSPLGEIVSAPGRGAWMGNRGRLHEGAGTRIVVRPYQSRAWITCRLEFRGARAAQWHPHHYTPLFFLDEAVSLAAGHRPCAECRRDSYLAFRDAARDALGVAALSAKALDAALHEQRWDASRSAHRTHEDAWADLPGGAFVLVDDESALVLDDRLVPWLAHNTYGPPVERPTSGVVTVITPQLTIEVLRAGYPVQVGA